MYDVTVVHSLAALRHLRLWTFKGDYCHWDRPCCSRPLVGSDGITYQCCQACWADAEIWEAQAAQPSIPPVVAARGPNWDLLTDDVWAHVFSFLDTKAKTITQQTCRRFNGIFMCPPTRDTWGRVEFANTYLFKGELPLPKARHSVHVWELCKWVRPRLAGIRAISLFQTDDKVEVANNEGTTKMWHALVASTAGTDIRLRLRRDPFHWHSKDVAARSLLSASSRTELVQRLTVLDICVADAADIAAVHSLAALRHLRLWTRPRTDMRLFDAEPNAETRPCQLSSLRTLQLYNMLPQGFFTTGVAASLQHLHSLRLFHCPLSAGCIPADVLQLPSVERLELMKLRLVTIPDMHRLPALQTLVMYDGPKLDADAAAGSSELPGGHPLGGATALTQLHLCGTPVAAQRCAEAIERLPHLKELHLDYWSDDVAAFWAATLQRRLHGRCSVQPEDGNIIHAFDWAGDDW